MIRNLFLALMSIFLVAHNAHAYIGPGLGLGVLGVIAGVIGSIFLAVFAIFWYPIKRFFKKMRKK